MRIEDYPTQSVKMNAIEVELVQENRKVLVVLGNSWEFWESFEFFAILFNYQLPPWFLVKSDVD